MFGFSLTKLIFTVVIVIAAWQAFKYFTRLSEQREKRAQSVDGASKTSAPGVEDMVQCSVCEAYAARGSKSCGKAGCPFRG